MYESHCPVCMRVYVEPVILPCEHCFCKPCFDAVVQQSNLQCPLCRKRIGSWARLSTRKGTLVDTKMWSYIKRNYPDEVKARLAGCSTPKKASESNGMPHVTYLVTVVL